MTKTNQRNNVEKSLPARGDLKDKKKLADLEGELFEIELGLLDTLKEAYEREDPGTSFREWLDSKQDDYFKRIKLSSGGSTSGKHTREKYKDLIDAFERGVDVILGESLTQYINRIRASEKKND